MNWQKLDLVEKAKDGEDGARVRSAEEVLRGLIAGNKLDTRPCLVWIVDVSEKQVVRRIEIGIFDHELTCIVLSRFHCFRVARNDLPEQAEKPAAGFLFLDPSGKPCGKPVVGKRMLSRSRFVSRIDKVFSASYTMGLKELVRGTIQLLDRRDHISEQRKVIRWWRTRLLRMPDPAVTRMMDKKEAEVNKEQKALDHDEKALLAKCVLSPRWLPARTSK